MAPSRGRATADSHEPLGPEALRTDDSPGELADSMLSQEWEVVARQEAVAEGLVKLRNDSLEDILREVDSLDRVLVEGHAERWEAAWAAHVPCSACDAQQHQLEGEHLRFRTSAEQLRWFLSIVQREDHGGHRQALGQYWKILLEALERHLTEEGQLLRHLEAPERRPAPRPLQRTRER